MIKSGKLCCAVILAVIALVAPKLSAQFPAPPPLPSDLPAPQIPPRDIPAEVKQMTKRYGLNEEQAKKVSAILEEHAKKADEIAKDDSLSPEQKVPQLLATKDEERKEVSEVLTPEQRKKFEADVHPSAPPKAPADGESKPTPPSGSS